MTVHAFGFRGDPETSQVARRPEPTVSSLQGDPWKRSQWASGHPAKPCNWLAG